MPAQTDQEQPNRFRSPWPSPVIQDCAIIAVIVALSALPYTRGLGFYSDDWQFLGFLTTSADPSFLGLFHQLITKVQLLMRPVQALSLEILYLLFGQNPLGYHIVIAGILVLNGILLYIASRQVTRSRPVALSIAFVFSLLPNYSTDRLWIAEVQNNVSTTLYLASFLLSLKTLEMRKWRLWFSSGAVFLLVVASILAYEQTLPLFLFALALLWYMGRRSGKTFVRPRVAPGFFVLSVSTITAAILSGLYTLETTVRYHPRRLHIKRIAWLLSAVKQMVKVHFVDYAAALPSIDLTLIEGYHRLLVWMLGLASGALAFWYLRRTIRGSPDSLPGFKTTLKLMAFGLLVLGVGYSIFWFVPLALAFTPTGILNRTAEVPCIGVAVVLVGGASLLGIAGMRFSRTLRTNLFCLVIAFLVVSGFLINNYIASFWIEASQRQAIVLKDIRTQFSALPPGETLLLDGVCPYVGPGIVFETNWDVSGALQTIFHDPKAKGNTVSHNTTIGSAGMTTRMYGIPDLYTYGNDLIVFNVRNGVVRRLVNEGAAHAYFGSFDPGRRHQCPPGKEGYESPLWDFYVPGLHLQQENGDHALNTENARGAGRRY